MSGGDDRHSRFEARRTICLAPPPEARAPTTAASGQCGDDDLEQEDEGEAVVTVTFFPNFAAATKRERSLSFDQLAEVIHTTSAPTKDQLPWLKLARFGDRRTEKGSLRHNANVAAITGIEGDYDVGKISLADAKDIIGRAGVTAIVYPSPSYSPGLPRWRVLCPFSREYPPAARDRFMARLNGVFRGAFSRESWVLSQSYYFGRVANPDHHATVLGGDPIDLRDDLDAGAIGLPPERNLGRRAHPKSRPEDISETRVRGLVNSLLDNIRKADNGEKHFVLRDTCLTLGGYFHLIDWSVDEAVEQAVSVLPSADDWDQARQTARWGIERGMEKPLDLEARPSKQRKATGSVKAAGRPETDAGQADGKAQWIWHSADYDFPVERTDETYLSDDGIQFVGIRNSDGSHTFVPEHELTAAGQASAPQPPEPAPPPLADCLPFRWSSSLTPVLDTQDFVEGVLTKGCLAVVYGDSNVGKSFWVVDLCLHIAGGIPWNGREVEQGIVIFAALEGGRMVDNRVIAARDRLGLPPTVPLMVVQCPIDLRTNSVDAERLSNTIKRAIAECPGPFPVQLVAIDTMSRALNGGNEGAEEMSALLRNVDQIRHETGVAILFVAHCGKDAARGIRGWSGIRAAIDVEIETSLRADGAGSVSEVTKQRDLPTGDQFNFRLDVVELGHNRRGKPVTTCVIAPLIDDAPGDKPQARLSGDKARAYEVLANTIITRGRPGATGVPYGFHSVSEDEWREAFYGAAKPGVTQSAKRKAFGRAADALIDTLHLVGMANNRVWIPRKQLDHSDSVAGQPSGT